MERINIVASDSPHFIGAWYMDDLKICDELIQFFEEHQEKQKQGVTLGGFDPNLKNSLDLSISPADMNTPSHKAIKKYIGQLYNCYMDYTKQWPFLAKTFPALDIGRFNLQKYNPGGHFAHIHSERTDIASLHRLFAFMTYLNDDFEDGETHFIHQQLKIKPEKGKTLIWPAEWTHAHAGEVVNAGSKYIATGWMLLPH
ncbi:MAG TPA: 2OG-Fe(II) oxygenase [Methylophilaceae bacterium]|nr:2OG-Fe(II) oxygenase [Methylophilaceae bacterium]